MGSIISKGSIPMTKAVKGVATNVSTQVPPAVSSDTIRMWQLRDFAARLYRVKNDKTLTEIQRNRQYDTLINTTDSNLLEWASKMPDSSTLPQGDNVVGPDPNFVNPTEGSKPAGESSGLFGDTLEAIGSGTAKGLGAVVSNAVQHAAKTAAESAGTGALPTFGDSSSKTDD